MTMMPPGLSLAVGETLAAKQQEHRVPQGYDSQEHGRCLQAPEPHGGHGAGTERPRHTPADHKAQGQGREQR